MKTCPACSAENNAEGKFCSACGGVLAPGPAGQPAHQSGSIDQLHRAHAASLPRRPAELVADLDPAVERAIRHSLQKDPRQRPASARAVAEALVARETPSPAQPPPESSPEGQPSLAVLPFVNMNADHENEFLSDGISEDLIMALSRLKDLRVPARTSSFAFKGKNEDIRRIGQLLNVETVLEGSVRKSGNRLRVTAQLVKVCDGFHLWSERYDREMKDVFDIQDDISRAIVAALEVQLGGQADANLVRPQTASMEAYELCVKGRGHWIQRGLGLKKGVHYFELALLEDPNYALAWSGLADAYFMLGIYDLLPFREGLAKAKTAAEKAVALDDNSAEAHCSLGVVLGWCDWDWHGSERHLLKALELNPNCTPARYWYGWLMVHKGRDQESIAQNRRAVEGDPLSKLAHAYLGMSFNSLRLFAEAIPPLRRSLELDPNFAFSHWQLGRAYWFLGDREAALVELHRAVELSGQVTAFCLSTLGQALALSGEVGQARQIQRELAERTIPAPTRPYYLSHLHAALGDNDLAFAALEQALDEREFFLAWFPVGRDHIDLISLEPDPRWPVFIEKVKAAVQAGASATI